MAGWDAEAGLVNEENTHDTSMLGKVGGGAACV